jgi:NADH-quinone oxidoreductase subunit M
MVAAAALGVIISAIYGLRAVSHIFFGQPTPAFQPLFDRPLPDIRLYERLPAILLLGVLMFVGFWPAAITRGINASLPSFYHDQPPATVTQPGYSVPVSPVLRSTAMSASVTR